MALCALKEAASTRHKWATVHPANAIFKTGNNTAVFGDYCRYAMTEITMVQRKRM